MSILIPTKRELIYQTFTFLLGAISPPFACTLIAIAIFLYLLFIFVLPKVHPGVLLKETQNGLTDTRRWITNEATSTVTDTTQREYWMRAGVKGLDDLKDVEERVESLLAQHETDCTIHHAFRYVKSLPKLVKDARKCQADLASLRSNLENEAHHLNDNVEPGEYHYPMLVAP